MDKQVILGHFRSFSVILRHFRSFHIILRHFRSFCPFSRVFSQFQQNHSANTEKLEIEERCLTVGDFCWTVTDKNTKNEYLLDTIIERKAANDLAISITEKRLVDQKERLKLTKCKNPIYMIETGVNNKELEMQRVNCKALQGGFLGF